MKRMKKQTWLAPLILVAMASVASTSLGATQAPAASTKSPSARAFARLSVPKHTLYVGESVPITMQTYFAAGTGVTLTGAPTANTPDFTLAVGEPAQARAAVGGETYLLVSWKGHLSPAKAGRYALQTSIPATLEWQAIARRAERPPSAADPFADGFDLFGSDDQGDPFAAMQQRMQRMMDQFQSVDVGPVQKKSVVLTSPSAALTVLPLPDAGRPSTFSGAVGHFEVAATVDTSRVRVGEPIELRLVVRGQGSLDRMSTPGLPDSKVLRTYAPTVTQKDDTKTFVQALVPQQPGPAEIPPVELSYFDPDAARYVTQRTAAIPIEVAPGQALTATSTGSVPDATTGPTLAPNADLEGKPVRSLRPLYARSGFWWAQLAPLGMLAAAVSLIVRRRRIGADPHHAMRRGARRALRQHRRAMDRAFAAGDAPAFLAAARGALQQRLGALWGLVPEAITQAEVERRLEGPHRETLRTIFEMDAARFGGGPVDHDLARWNEAVRRVLAHPEAS